MSIQAITNHLSNIRLATPKEIKNRLTKLAVPVVTITALAIAQKAQSITVAECFKNVDDNKDAHELAKIICYALCLLFSKG